MKLRLPLLGLFTSLLLLSCDQTETFDDRWQLDNEAQFVTISGNSEYQRLASHSGNGYIMYKVIEEGDSNGETPLFTDRVKVLYTGWYKNIWSMPDIYTDDKGNQIYNKIVFDSTENRNNIPSTFFVNPNASSGSVFGVIDGFSTALQYMHIGDKWEVWIPWKLGYGESSSGSIPAYTTLVFEIELVDIL